MYQTMTRYVIYTGKQKEDKFITNGDSALPDKGDYFVMNHTQSKVRQR